jgi:hypothetical protein
MKHSSTRAVFEYWNRQRAHRPAPERGDIDPAAIRYALGDSFMLAADFIDQPVFRLAGTRVCALFGREMKGELFAALWGQDSRETVEELLTIVTAESAGAVAGLIGRTEDGNETEIEMLLLPLAHSGQARIRALGVLVPVSPPYWLGERPVIELTLRTLRHLDGDTERGRPSVLRSPHGRLPHGFVVHRGGRAAPDGERTG